MSRKRVILHIGAPKTGSSALQVYFSANVTQLADVGVTYPYPEPESVLAVGTGTGNIVQILFRDGLMIRPRPWQNMDATFFRRLADLVEASASDTVLFSSEALISLTNEQIHNLTSHLRERYETVLVAFVRDAFDYWYSAWKQRVKTHRNLGSFLDDTRVTLARPHGLPVFGGYERYRRFGIQPIVLNYDTYKSDIVGAFFTAAGIERPRAEVALKHRGYNRSLTTSEAELLARVNEAFKGTSFPRTVACCLLRHDRQPVPDTPYYSREVHQGLLDRYGSVIETMNEVIVGGPLSTRLRDTPSVEPTIAPSDLDALVEATSLAVRHTSQPSKPKSRVLARLLRSSGQKGLPPDFDREAYLFLNPDVAQSTLAPELHYLAHGQSEGRHFKYV